MDESDEILIGVAESHSTSDTTLEEACRAAHAESNHALVLVPDVDHAVELVVARLDVVDVEEVVPVFA